MHSNHLFIYILLGLVDRGGGSWLSCITLQVFNSRTISNFFYHKGEPRWNFLLTIKLEKTLQANYIEREVNVHS